MSRIEEKFKQLTTETKVIILVFILGLFAAWMFRYTAPVHVKGGYVSVTDRWTGCVTFHFVRGDQKNTSCP